MPRNPDLPPPPERPPGSPPPGHLADDDTQLIPRAVPDHTVPNWELKGWPPQPPDRAAPTGPWPDYLPPPPSRKRKRVPRSTWRTVMLCFALFVVAFVVALAVIGTVFGKKNQPAPVILPRPSPAVTHHVKAKHHKHHHVRATPSPSRTLPP